MPLLLFIVILQTLFCAQVANAEPVVILDEGGISTEEYRRALLPASKVPDFGGQWIASNYPNIERDPTDPSLWLPLTTHKLRPGRILDEKEVRYELDAPICVVGSDALSLRWIKKNLEGLTFIKARCWLVQANNFRDYQAVATALRGQVMLLPADGDDVADFFQISRYPVIIDERYIGQ